MPVRIFFAVTLALAAFLGGSVWWVALVMIPVNFIGTTTGNFNSLAMGRGGNPYWKDFIGMSIHGFLSSGPPAIVFALLHGAWFPALIGGLVISPLYTAGWAITGLPPGKQHWPKGMQQGSEIAELLWGGAMGVGLFLSAFWS